MEEKMSIDESAFYEEEKTVKTPVSKETESKKERKTTASKKIVEPVNCLRNERVVVKFVPKNNNNIKDKKHLAYGGMMENAIRVFAVPILSSGSYKNVLTDNEKAYLEEIMGLEPNALSVHAKNDNYWDTVSIRLTKQGVFYL